MLAPNRANRRAVAAIRRVPRALPALAGMLVLLGAAPAAAVAAGDPAAERVRADVAVLADAACGGRRPATAGARQARHYLIEQLRRTPAQPAGVRGYEQPFVAAAGDTLVNLVAVLPGDDRPATHRHVVAGAHYDHLGVGDPGGPHAGEVFPGADDNASGTAALLELARTMQAHRHDIVLVFFDGEEQGRLGSRYYAEHPVRPLPDAIAMVNFDTIGRLADHKLTVFGVATAAAWETILKGVNMGFGFQLLLIPQTSAASDDLSFLEKGVAAVHLFTGAHADYHRPSDTADRVDAQGVVQIAAFAAELSRYLADRDAPLPFLPAGAEQAAQQADAARAASGGAPQERRRVSLGTIPDFQRTSGGVLLAGVLPGSPAAQVGLQAGDLLVELAGAPIDNLADYSEALKRHAPGDRVSIVYVRDGRRATAEVVLVERK